MLKWSQLRKRIRDCVCPELRNRIDFHATGYHAAHDGVGEAWITVDAEKVLGGGHYRWWKVWCAADEASRPSGDSEVESAEACFARRAQIEQQLLDQGTYETAHLAGALSDYLNTSLDDAFVSENALIRALAMVDRRLGRRRFRKIVLGPSEPPIVTLFHGLRAAVMAERPDRKSG